MLQAPESGWTARTEICSGLTGKGIPEIYQMMQDYRSFTISNNYFFEKRKSQQHQLFLSSLEEQLVKRFFSDNNVSQKIKDLKKSGNFHPFSEAKKILDEFLNKTNSPN